MIIFHFPDRTTLEYKGERYPNINEGMIINGSKYQVANVEGEIETDKEKYDVHVYLINV